MSKQIPVLGSLNHLSFSVSDYEKSIKFYDSFLTRLGYKKSYNEVYYTAWTHQLNGGQIGVSPIKPENKESKHTRYSVGFHHLALNASTREQVDEFHEFLVKNEYTVLDEPKEYDYVPGYYAVFWEDPDGMKLEFCHVPIRSSISTAEGEPEAVIVEETNGNEPEGKDHEGGGENDENSPKRQKTE